MSLRLARLASVTVPVEARARSLAPARAREAARSLSRHPNLLAAALYVAAALVMERAAVAHFNSVCACNAGAEPTQFMWAMVWWPYALMHGLNPFVTRVIWTPVGITLGSATSVPGLAFLAWPITAVAGPLVAFNVFSLAAPVLSAWFAYRLCLYVTRQPWPAIVGGYLFGFSTYELAHLIGLLHTVFVFPLPLLVLLTLKRVDEVIGPRRYVVQVAALLVFELLVSTEVLLTMTCMAAVALLLAAVLGTPHHRQQIAKLLPLLALAYAAMAAICSPLLYYALAHNTPYSAGWGPTYSADLLNFVFPTEVTQLGSHQFASVARAYPGNPTENGAYLGVPVLIGTCAYAVKAWRTRGAKLLVGCFIVAAIWSLGSRLWVDGHLTISLPWALFDKLPLLDQLLPVRVAAYTALASALMFAGWLALPGRRRYLRWCLAAVAVASIWPNTAAVYPSTTLSLLNGRYEQPRMFTTDMYRHYLHHNEVVLPLPYGRNGPSLLWQAQTGMWFKLASGHFHLPSTYNGVPAVEQLLADNPGPDAAAALRSFIIAHHIGAVLAQPGYDAPWQPALTKLGLQRQDIGGIVLYRVPPKLLP